MKKTCTQCHETKNVDEFYLSAYKVPAGYCKKCAKRKYDNSRRRSDKWIELFIGDGKWYSAYFNL